MQSDVKEIHKWYPTETRGIQLWLVGKRDELMKGEGGLEGKRISYEDSLSMLVVVLCCVCGVAFPVGFGEDQPSQKEVLNKDYRR